MKGGTLFSGIGAPEVAAPWIDWRWSADVDDFANAVRAHHWPSVPNLGDVGAIEHDAIEPVDLVVFGSPCQSFSVAGKRLGLDDPRGNLALVALRMVASIRPRWFVFENVPGLLSSADGEDFAAFLRTVRQCGYTGAYRVLDAQYFGVPQRRRRVFFVGHLGDDWRPSAAVLFEPESLRGDTAPRREERQDVAPTISARPTGGGGLGTDFDLDGGLIAEPIVYDGVQITAPVNRQNRKPGDPCHTLARDNAAYATVIASTGSICATDDRTHALTAEGFDASEDSTGRGNPLVASSCKDHGADASDTSPTLRAMGHDGSHANGGGQVAVAFGAKMSVPQVDVDLMQTLQAANPMAVAHGPMVRRLTPAECEALQGFPRGFTDIPWRNGRAPDGRRYKALGNSMAVPVLRWIIERIGHA